MYICPYGMHPLPHDHVTWCTIKTIVWLFLEWVICAWAPYAGSFDDSTYLLMDEFSVHLTSECVNAIQSQGTEVDFIAGGYTGALQILDKGVNKPFKQHV